MPYTSNKDLPDKVKNNLPEHAQTVYRKTYNSAYEQYGEETRAHKVAWAAVEKEYKKNKDGKWIKRN